MGDTMTMHLPTGIQRGSVEPDREARAVAGQTARSLMRNFPGWVCWYGLATRAWWGLPPPAYRYPALIEAATAGELALRIRQMSAAGPKGHKEVTVPGRRAVPYELL